VPSRTGALQFARIHAQPRLSRQRQFQHGQPRGGGGPRRAAVRRLAAGDQSHLGQAEGFQQLQRRAQMAEVYRIEGAAQYADGPH
jgi:hypothetical protein